MRYPSSYDLADRIHYCCTWLLESNIKIPVSQCRNGSTKSWEICFASPFIALREMFPNLLAGHWAFFLTTTLMGSCRGVQKLYQSWLLVTGRDGLVSRIHESSMSWVSTELKSRPRTQAHPWHCWSTWTFSNKSYLDLFFSSAIFFWQSLIVWPLSQ